MNPIYRFWNITLHPKWLFVAKGIWKVYSVTSSSRKVSFMETLEKLVHAAAFYGQIHRLYIQTESIQTYLQQLLYLVTQIYHRKWDWWMVIKINITSCIKQMLPLNIEWKKFHLSNGRWQVIFKNTIFLFSFLDCMMSDLIFIEVDFFVRSVSPKASTLLVSMSSHDVFTISSTSGRRVRAGAGSVRQCTISLSRCLGSGRPSPLNRR